MATVRRWRSRPALGRRRPTPSRAFASARPASAIVSGMRLGDVLPDLAPELGDLEVSSVCDDSRAVTPGALFVAIAGLTVDGHDYARTAA
ncbi:MAG: hypothetical protein KC503_16985, partial [Myxococcales bacterium]|nr:hypothetical protein [Myxococcales bacterium]